MSFIAFYLFLSPATTGTATTTTHAPSTMEEEITIDAGSILSFYKETREEKKVEMNVFQLIIGPESDHCLPLSLTH